ncbi:MAG: FAD-linked oxidase C-terminal domain-containing protein [Holophaga sp.]|nr:FAD-linked oxidase C-terminal domain-containing protein [Holophaga sp.]
MKISDALVREIRSITGAEGCLSQPEDLRCYSYDLFARGKPDLVVLPQTTEEVAQVLKLANEDGIPVSPRGAGSSLTGGPVPIKGGIALGLARMNRILEISSLDRLARLQPGVVTHDFQMAVAKKGFFYPPDPASNAFCTIGGNVATNAGGPSGVKYGVTRDYLLGLTLAAPSGDILATGGRSFKNVTGYDFTHFLCGSEGMLGAITEITVKLLPRPEAVRTLLAFYPDVASAVESVAQIMGNAIIPATLEIMDQNFLEAVDNLYGFGFPKGAGAALLIEVDGPEILVGPQAAAILELCTKGGALAVQSAGNSEERDKLWKARRAGTAALVRQAKFMVTLDFCVPISSIAQAVREVQEIGKRCDLKTVVIGHAGDGNLHPLFFYDPDDPRQARAYAEMEEELVRSILNLSGTLSGEHGIGLEKAHYLRLEKAPFELQLSRRMKMAFDPKLIMNPGKCEWADQTGSDLP